MDAERFDRLALSLRRARTRRSVVALLAGLGLTRRVTRAASVCQENGARCGRATDHICCSGRCVRKHGTHKKFCRRVPSQGICTFASNACVAGGVITGCAKGGGSECQCYVTSDGFSFCGDTTGSACFTCETNADCEQRFGGKPGDRCVQCPICGPSPDDRACFSKCPNPASA